MFGTLPVVWDDWNREYFPDNVEYQQRAPICLKANGGNNLWRAYREPIYFGLDSDGNFVVYAPKSQGLEGFDTPGVIQGREMVAGWRGPAEVPVTEFKLDWCTFYSPVQTYWNLGKQNTWSTITVR